MKETFERHKKSPVPMFGSFLVSKNRKINIENHMNSVCYENVFLCKWLLFLVE